MSTIDKMLIKGIRSFDPENKHVITFLKPLTLIVGSNGAGKTTIIECLKLSCTGELPPNARSGQSFIHDPKVAGETETKAQIKLRFKTAAGKDVVCIRSFQLTQKAAKMEYKAIESVLQTISPNTGEKVCLSYRCADMDREIPALMGVSKAILENVIFVHQDEANWPLQDSSTLKKKFDDIFSATRYTKALEVIKKLHKEQAQEIKSYKLKLEHLQTLKDSAYKLRESIAQDQERTESLEFQVKTLNKEIKEVEDKIRHTEAKLQDQRTLQDQITKLSASRNASFTEQEQRFHALNEESIDTDEELKEWKENFEQKISQQNVLISRLEREKTDLEQKIENFRESKTETIVEIRDLERETEAHASLKNERDSIIRKLFTIHNLGSIPNGSFSDEMVLNCTNRLKARLTELERDVQEKKKSNKIEVDAAWESHQNAYYRLRDVEAKKDAKADTKDHVSKKIKEKEKERDSYEDDISKADINRLDEREKYAHIEVERKTKLLADRMFDETIEEKQSELNSLIPKIKNLSREKDLLDNDSENRYKLGFRKSELENHRQKLKKLLDENKDKIRGVLRGRLPPEKDLKKKIDEAFSSTSSEFKDADRKSREAEKEVDILRLKIQEVSNKLNKLQGDMESRKQLIETKLPSPGLGVDSYLQALDKAKKNRDQQKSQYNVAAGMCQMFDPFMEIARSQHFCPCCERPFSAEEEREFVEKQRLKSATSAENMKKVATLCEGSDSIFQQLDNLRVVYEEYMKLSKETIPQAEADLAEFNEELEQKTLALDDILGITAQVKADKDSIEALLPYVDAIHRHWNETQNLQTEVDKLENTLNYPILGVRSIDEIKSELGNLQNARDKLQLDLDNLKEDQRYMEATLSSAKTKLHSAKEEKFNALGLVENLNKVEEELKSLLEERNNADFEEKQLAEAMNPLEKESSKLLSDYNVLRERLDREVDKQADLVRSHQQEVEDLLKLNSKIEGYDEIKKAEHLKDARFKRSQIESGLQNCEQRIRNIPDELNSAQETKMNNELLKINIKDNIAYRETKARVVELTRQLELLEQRQVEIGSVNISETELKKLNQERERLRSEVDRFHGTMSVYMNNISKNRSDLKQPQYKDIDKRYFDQLIQLKTTEMANKDLDRYYNALDNKYTEVRTLITYT